MKPYQGAIEVLPVRHQRAYEKRRLENITHFGLPVGEADGEARLFIAGIIYKEQSRKAEVKKQQPLFDGKLPKMRRTVIGPAPKPQKAGTA